MIHKLLRWEEISFAVSIFSINTNQVRKNFALFRQIDGILHNTAKLCFFRQYNTKTNSVKNE